MWQILQQVLLNMQVLILVYSYNSISSFYPEEPLYSPISREKIGWKMNWSCQEEMQKLPFETWWT